MIAFRVINALHHYATHLNAITCHPAYQKHNNTLLAIQPEHLVQAPLKIWVASFASTPQLVSVPSHTVVLLSCLLGMQLHLSSLVCDILYLGE